MANDNSANDLQLVRFLQQGDEAAFAEIYQRYAATLAGFAASKLYDLEDARDIIHDLFVKLWEDRKTLLIKDSLRAYLFTAVRYRIVDKIRRSITSAEYAQMVQSLAATAQTDGEEQLHAKQLQQAIEKHLNELPPRAKEIYQLSRQQNLSVREIAEKLQISEQTVKNQLTTVLKHLRLALGSSIVPLLVYWWLR